MSLPPIDPYVETYFWLSAAWKQNIPDQWVRRDGIERWLTEQMMVALEPFGTEVCRPYPSLASNIFDRLVDKGLLAVENNTVSGIYYHIDVESLKNFRGSFLEGNDLHRQHAVIGAQLFHDIFSAYGAGGLPEGSIQAVEGATIPASDRVVSLTHNQIEVLSEPLSELIGQVEQSNGNPDHPGFRERILGQLKAGRELMRAGVFRAYFLYSILLTALSELISKHKGTAIAATAESLLGLLIQQVFSGN